MKQRYVGLWLALLLLLPRLVLSATYYTAPGGNNGNPGTIGSPFQTIVRGMQAAQSPGDTLNVRAGTYTEVIDYVTVNPYPSGSPGNPITIRAFPGETVIIAGTGDHTFGLGVACHDLVFNGFIFDGENSFSTLSIGDESAGDETFCTDVVFSNNEIRHSGGCGGGYHTVGLISSNGSNCSCTGIRLSWINNYIHTSWCGYGFYSGGHDNLWDGNIIENNAGFGIQLYDGYHFAGISNNIIRNNIFRGNGFVRAFGAMTLWHGTGNKIYNNLIISNYDGISVGREQNGLQIYHNTVYNNGGGIYTSYDTSLNTIIRNNIVYLSGDIHDGVGGVGTVQDHNLVGTNPLFVNAAGGDFHLQAGSPARDTGVTLAAVPTDFSGTARPQGAGVDLGAYEYGDASPGATKVAWSVQPQSTRLGESLPVLVAQIQDATSTLVSSSVLPISVALGSNPGSTTLTGTVTRTPVGGQVAFPDLSLNAIASGYTFLGSASGLTTATSSAFDITAPRTAAWVTDTVRALRCQVLGGGTNTSNVGWAADVVHTVSCTVPARALTAQATLKACALFALHTGISTNALSLALYTASGPIVRNSGPPPPANISQSASWVCWSLVSTGGPGGSVSVSAAFENHYPEGIQYTSEVNTVAQPVTLATDAPLSLSVASQWGGAGSGDATLTLLALTVEVER